MIKLNEYLTGEYVNKEEKKSYDENEHEKNKKDCNAQSLFEIVSSDDREVQTCDNNNMIIVELISYICGNPKLISFYPKTKSHKSKQSKYLYHFYKKKKVKLYLCLSPQNNEIFIYKVKYKNKNKNRYTKNESITNDITVTPKNEFNTRNDKKVEIKKESKTNNPLLHHEHITVKHEPKNSLTKGDIYSNNNTYYNSDTYVINSIKKKEKNNNYGKKKSLRKIYIKKLFDSVNSNYHFDKIEFIKLSGYDEKMYNTMKTIIEQTMNKKEQKITNNMATKEANNVMGNNIILDVHEKRKLENSTKINIDYDITPNKHNSYFYNSFKNQTYFPNDIVFDIKNNSKAGIVNCSKFLEKNYEFINDRIDQCTNEHNTHNVNNDNNNDNNNINVLFLYFHEPTTIFMNNFVTVDK
ncbi:hypothetical protein HEP_00342900, partial [Hepatocystis sp. ex Piliocolobus tephrosceles]